MLIRRGGIVTPEGLPLLRRRVIVTPEGLDPKPKRETGASCGLLSELATCIGGAI